MYIYSGDYRKGDCGHPTNLIDCTGRNLFVGDIVISSSIDKFGICSNHGLSAVVSTKYTSYSDGTHTKNDTVECFVMGIRNVDFMNKDSDSWIVTKLKDFSECIDGEKWKDYGFRYSLY
jgi:hypothetical protein